MKYYWIRIFDYNYERDGSSKGTKLDEFYLKNIEDREKIKNIIKNKCNTLKLNDIYFRRPKKKNVVYAIILDSTEFFYNRFCNEIDTFCFFCHKKIKGKEMYFKNKVLSDEDDHHNKKVYFCDYDCLSRFKDAIYYSKLEGEFQQKAKQHNNILGYIYHIYNRVEDKHYIGQTMYMPFFRWQEHIKNGDKGNICDMIFDVITEIYHNNKKTTEENKRYINNIEAWWINKFKQDGCRVFNIKIPKVKALKDFEEKFNQLLLEETL